MSQIALINPPSPFLIDQKVFPNMGLARVATHLKKDGHQVYFGDFANKNPDEIKHLSRWFHYFGFSATTPQMPVVNEMNQRLKKSNPNIHTILGGPHASALYQLKQNNMKDINIKDAEQFDTIFAGEGESTENIFKPGWQKGKLITNIDDVEIPDRNFMKGYNYDLNGKKTTSIQTQRGCPYSCAFCCGRDIEMYNKVRQHSPERVLKELDKLNGEFGYESFMWYNDEVNLNPKSLEKLCAELAKRDYQHRGFVRSDQIAKNPASVKWLKDAGFVKLATGVESGSDQILKRIGKKTTADMNTKARQYIGDAGIHYEAFMILGHPGETMLDVNKTYDWLATNKPDDFDLNILTPYPGCKIYNEGRPSDKFDEYSFEHKGLYFNKPRYSETDSYYKGIGAQSESDVRTKELDNKTLKKLRNDIEASLK